MTRLNREDHEEKHRYKGQNITSFRLAQKLNSETVPTIVFLTSDGNYLLHLSGFVEAKELRPVLEYIATESYRHQTFPAFMNQTGS
jgi:thioredoxin-related protein